MIAATLILASLQATPVQPTQTVKRPETRRLQIPDDLVPALVPYLRCVAGGLQKRAPNARIAPTSATETLGDLRARCTTEKAQAFEIGDALLKAKGVGDATVRRERLDREMQLLEAFFGPDEDLLGMPDETMVEIKTRAQLSAAQALVECLTAEGKDLPLGKNERSARIASTTKACRARAETSTWEREGPDELARIEAQTWHAIQSLELSGRPDLRVHLMWEDDKSLHVAEPIPATVALPISIRVGAILQAGSTP
ncbi:hypothetical protein [Sphingomonas sp.]|uniref:hypothetical protein n=1 Tax=Sphingomonas sp. TaxID=28214 RepID=UPI002ED8BFD3